MFDVQKIGSRISALRKDSDMTQMELADRMGISFQAVSNWERGNSMPDIAKLGELAQILGVSIDALIGDASTATVVEKVLEPEANAPLNTEEFIAVAPLMKPKLAEKSADRMNFAGATWKDIHRMAPFLRQETLDEMALKVRSSADYKQLAGLMPFLSKDVVDELFLSASSADGDLSKVVVFAPFVSKEALEFVVEEQISQTDFTAKKILSLAPFLKKSTLRKVATKCIEQEGFEGIMPLLPFLGKKFLDDLCKSASAFTGEEN